jgi:lipid II:glycine glycyltransferase (peptidoglycan interpeptide bridge formation enzyme)
MYAASSKKGKKLYAPTLNTWEAIRLSKKKGSSIYDFEGIYDSRFPLKTWRGFTRFKKSFGGKEIKYPGAFVKHRLPI